MVLVIKMTYKQATEYIDSFLMFGSKLGLTRITKLLSDLGNPQDTLKFIHIAGTNGKGSTAYYCESVLRHAGYKVGMFVSPYIVDFRERFQINSQMISESDLCDIVARIKAICDTYPKDELPTEFEIVTAIGMVYFAEQKCDMVVLEVGLGGRLDSTNVIKTPDVCAITSLSLDHTQYLGETIDQIAYEKGGIIKAGAPVVLYPLQESGALETIEQICRERNSKLIIPNLANTLEKSIFGEKVEFDGLEFRLAIPGDKQKYNASVAITALRECSLELDDEQIVKGLESAKIPARLEVLSTNPKILLDGAHNPDGVVMLEHTLDEYFDSPVGIIGMMKDKDIEKVLEKIAPKFSKIYTVTVDNPRSETADNLAKTVKKYCADVHACESVESAISCAQAENKDFCVCGSLYLCSQARKILKK